MSFVHSFVPCPVVARVNLDGHSVRLDGTVRVLHLNVLMAHQGPRREVPAGIGLIEIGLMKEMSFTVLIV